MRENAFRQIHISFTCVLQSWGFLHIRSLYSHTLNCGSSNKSLTPHCKLFFSKSWPGSSPWTFLFQLMHQPVGRVGPPLLCSSAFLSYNLRLHAQKLLRQDFCSSLRQNDIDCDLPRYQVTHFCKGEKNCVALPSLESSDSKPTGKIQVLLLWIHFSQKRNPRMNKPGAD